MPDNADPGQIETPADAGPERIDRELAHIEYRVDDRVATVTLDRPERMNAMNLRLCRELRRAIAAADADDDVRVVILRGAGDRAFSAGYDLRDDEMEEISVDTLSARTHADLTFTQSVWRCSKPTIAMIHGHCLGGALELAQMCDIRYAAENATFGVVETRFSVGVVTMVMPWVIGQAARELIYTGDVIDAAEALRLGLVNRVFAADALERETLKVARRMSRVALAALRWNKRAINAAYETMGFETALRHGSEHAMLLNATSTPEYRAFAQVQSEQGLTAAIRWREAQFEEFG
jgi:enoyl-CoA hydratase/carnithine racemase